MQSFDDECPICLDKIHPIKNRATTECGHCFHSSCLIKHSVLTNIVCPMCRCELTDIPESDDESEEGEEEDEDEYDDDTSSEEESTEEIPENIQRRNITQIISVMTRQNITIRNLVSALISITYQPSWIEKYFIVNDADNKEDEVMEILDNISSLPVDYRDTRRYAEVLLDIPPVSEAGIGPALVN